MTSCMDTRGGRSSISPWWRLKGFVLIQSLWPSLIWKVIACTWNWYWLNERFSYCKSGVSRVFLYTQIYLFDRFTFFDDWIWCGPFSYKYTFIFYLLSFLYSAPKAILHIKAFNTYNSPCSSLHQPANKGSSQSFEPEKGLKRAPFPAQCGRLEKVYCLLIGLPSSLWPFLAQAFK